jgi:Protein-L-isoaspartate(D-aspartate) O-methyltransferase (PCMT)
MTMCVKVGDGYQGWPECGPFDAVIVTAALGHVPPPLIEQLKVGGRLIMPLGPADAPQQLTVIEKIAPSETQTRPIILVQFVPLTRSLSAGTIDAAIDVLLPLPEEIRRQRLGTEWLTVVARRRHPKVVGMRSAFAVPHLLAQSSEHPNTFTSFRRPHA